ncbi:hypothetical protein [uncultured Tateyamaria sp.]|uniref:hypothetical protein n=1 Tax=uncultured Tateyamaria sp. TaxID=455651 RepID=UPI0026033E8B|nr:hypothetical protein [uncultured Tateyamaria sp.]
MSMDRLSRRARYLAWVTTAVMVLLPLGTVVFVASGGVDSAMLRAHYGVAVMPEALQPGPTLVWLGVEAARMALLLWIMWCVRRWLVLCSGDQALSPRAAQFVVRAGTGLMVLALAHVAGNTVIVGALTWDNPAGQRALSIGFGSTEILLVLAGCLVTLFGWIQFEAARLRAENEAFV